MGANRTQAVALLFFLLAFVAMAGFFAGDGIVVGLASLVLLGISAYFFMKCKPREYQND